MQFTKPPFPLLWKQAIVRRKSESEASGFGNLGTSTGNGLGQQHQGGPSRMDGLETARDYSPSFGLPGEPSAGPSPFMHDRSRNEAGEQFGEPGGLDGFEGIPEEMQDPTPAGDATNGEVFLEAVPLGLSEEGSFTAFGWAVARSEPLSVKCSGVNFGYLSNATWVLYR